MRKRILSLLPVIGLSVVLSIFAGSCDKATIDLSWKDLTCSGAYHSQTDTSTIKLTGIVEFDTPTVATRPILAQIIRWDYTILQGSQPVLNISDENLYSVLGDMIFSKSGEQSDFLWVMIETLTPKPGDIFRGATPDRIYVWMQILDNRGNVYTIEDNVPFEFTRD